MHSNTKRDSVIAVLALAGVLAVSLLSDQAIFQLRLSAERSFSYMAYLWAASLGGLVVCALALWAGYWLVVRASAHRLVGLLYLIVGGFSAVYIPLTFTFNLGLPLAPFIMSQNTYWTFAGGTMAVVGAFQLFRRRTA